MAGRPGRAEGGGERLKVGAGRADLHVAVASVSEPVGPVTTVIGSSPGGCDPRRPDDMTGNVPKWGLSKPTVGLLLGHGMYEAGAVAVVLVVF
jgi:hypothetical protein